MKKLFLATIISLSFFNCSNNEEVITIKKNKAELQRRANKNEEPLLRKMSNTFNKMVQNEEVFNRFRDNAESSPVHQGFYLFSANTIRDMIIKKHSFEKHFTETYEALYDSSLNYDETLKNLPKLNFGIPLTAFENYYEWRNDAFPIIAKSYDTQNNTITPIMQDDVIEMIGREHFEKLTSLHNGEKFYFLKNKEYVSIISGTKNEGAIIRMSNNEESETTNFASFEISDKGHYSSICLKTNESSFELAQANMFQYTYVDIFEPNVCKGYYVFDCNSVEYQKFLAKNQRTADETCETIWRCVPICCNGNVMWASFEFKPRPLRCAEATNHINDISMYALNN